MEATVVSPHLTGLWAGMEGQDDEVVLLLAAGDHAWEGGLDP